MNAKPQFEFVAGTGTLRVKRAPTVKMVSGRIALPKFGQCYVDGIVGYKDEQMVLDVKSAESREVVARITLPTGEQLLREGTCRIGHKSWKLVGHIRVNASRGVYMALRLPQVKIEPSANAF